MVYQDIIDWLERMEAEGYTTRGQVEEYIRGHQQGAIYHQQIDALDFYFGAEEPIERPSETLEQLQRGEEQRVESQREIEPEVQPPPQAPLPPEVIPETEQQRKSLARRLYNSLRGIFGGGQ